MQHDVEVFYAGHRLEGLPVLEPDHLHIYVVSFSSYAD
jgi:hypothetical protein